jgi:hypothetical protein
MTRHTVNAVEPDRAERWIEEFDAAKRPVPEAWTTEYVAFRLIEGFETLAKLPSGKTLPKAFGNGWPAIVRSYADAVGAEPERDKTEFVFEKARARASADEITRMDEALRWPMTYLRGRPGPATALSVWAFCRAQEWSISRELKKRGMARSTFERRRDVALLFVKRGLVKDQIAIR